MVTVLAAPDKFRETATARHVAEAIARAAEDAGCDAVECPLSDGGEGFLEVYGAAVGAVPRVSRVTGPLGGDVEAAWALVEDTAVVEMACASGLELAGGAPRNDPLGATTAGTGELIARAIAAGARTVVVGVGGSATTDGGSGAIDALRPHARLAGVEIIVACDVSTLFLDAAREFAPQKGASPAQVVLLRRRLDALARRYLTEFGVDVRAIPGAGAAGGLAGGLAALGASLRNGFDVVADAVGFEEAVVRADVVVTGEGFLDEGSFCGKVVGSVAAVAQRHGVPVVAVVGDSFACAPFDVLSLTELVGRERSMNDTPGAIREVVGDYLRTAFTTPPPDRPLRPAP